MNNATQPEIIGLDVSRNLLDIHCLGDDSQLRLPNTDGMDLPSGGRRLVDPVEERDELLAPVALGVAADGRPV